MHQSLGISHFPPDKDWCAKNPLWRRNTGRYSCLDEQRATVTMFRPPVERLASAYNYIKLMHTVGRRCCTADWGWRPSTYQVKHSIAQQA